MDTTFDRNVTRLTQGSIGKALLVLSLPIVLSNMLYTSYQLINAFWVGRLGVGAVAAVSVSFPVILSLVSLGSGMTVASAILAAQYAGARDWSAVSHLSAQALLLATTVSVAVYATGHIFVNPILRLMGITGGIHDDSAHYMQVSLIGFAFVFPLAMFQSILRGIGEGSSLLYVSIFSVFLNLALDPLLIFGWGPVPPMGVVGAAYATLITQGLVSLVGFRILCNGHFGVQLRLREFIPDMALIRRVLRLGLPASVEQSTGALGEAAFIFFVSHFGTTAIAAYGIGIRVWMLAMIPAFGISAATATLVGQSIGAGNLTRARETAVISAWYAFGILTGTAVLIFLCATHVVRFFITDNASVVREGALVVRFMAVCFGMLGAQMSLMGALRGSGNTFMAMVMVGVLVWGVQTPMAYCLSYYTALGEMGLWYSMPISDFVYMVAIVWFMKRYWRRLTSNKHESRKRVAEGAVLIEGG